MHLGHIRPMLFIDRDKLPPQVLGEIGHLACHPDLAVVDAPPVDMPAGIAQQEHAGRKTSHDGYEQHPECGLFVRQDRADPMLRVFLPEGQRNGPGEAGLVAQVQERGGVACGIRPPKGTDHGLVRGGLKVSSEEVVRKPENGVEPVETECDIGQGLRQIVPAADVGLLVEQNIAPVGFR